MRDTTPRPPPTPPWVTPDSDQKRRKGPAFVVGLLVTTLWFTVVVLDVVDLFDRADRDDDGSIADAGDVDVADLRVGDCFDDPGLSGDVAEIFSVVAQPCAEPHDNEVFHTFELEGETLPSDAAVGDEAFDVCVLEFEDFVASSYEDSELDFAWMWPTRQSWGKGDRTVTCAVYKMDGGKLEGSVAGTGR